MNKKKPILVFTIIILCLIFLGFFRTYSKVPEQSKTFYSLGTVSEITLLDFKKSAGEKVLDNCDKILRDIDNKMSVHIPGSDVSKINENAGKNFVKVSKDTFTVIEASIKYSKLSKGNFDVTIGPMSNLWGIGTDSAKVPSKSEIDNILNLIDYKDIVLDKNNCSVKLARAGMKIDLGAIAKGYAADKLAIYLKSNGVDSAILSLGGNIYTLGFKNNNEPFRVGIQDPQLSRGNSIGNIEVSNKSIVTSGVYERYIKKNNKIYHHMINPFNGYPFENELNSVTIISDKSINCDALSTSAFGLGLDEGLKMIEGIENIDAIFITKDNKIYLTNNIKNSFDLTDDNFYIAN